MIGADSLRAVQVAERDVGYIVGEAAADHLATADREPALRCGRRLAAGEVQVPHRQQRLVGLPPRARRGQRVGEDRAHRVATIAVHVARPQVRHRRHHRAHRSAGVGQRHHQPRRVEAPGAVARDAADHPRAHAREQRRGRGQPRRRVVVAGDRHHRQVRSSAVGLGEEAVPRGQRGRRRVAGVEDVAAHQHRVDGLGVERVEQPAQEPRVLPVTRQIVQRVSQVPVGGVQDAHARRYHVDLTAHRAADFARVRPSRPQKPESHVASASRSRWRPWPVPCSTRRRACSRALCRGGGGGGWLRSTR